MFTGGTVWILTHSPMTCTKWDGGTEVAASQVAPQAQPAVTEAEAAEAAEAAEVAEVAEVAEIAEVAEAGRGVRVGVSENGGPLFWWGHWGSGWPLFLSHYLAHANIEVILAYPCMRGKLSSDGL